MPKAPGRGSMLRVVQQVLFGALAIGLTLPCAARGRVIYVDADANGVNDGSDWTDAFNHLQDALEAASAQDEIRVAEGIYTPDTNSAQPRGSGDRASTFQLKTGVAMRGGYAGLDEPDPNSRDTRLHPTILSGDLLGDDGPGFSNNNENSYHVVTGTGVTATAVLDGFTITAGNAYGSDQTEGAGMYNLSSSPIIIDCSFIRNSACWYGGGMFNYRFSSPTLINCSFMDNDAHYGGGVENRYYSKPTLINCMFSGNTAQYGGATGNAGAHATYTNCTFAQNWAAKRGGGMYNRFDSKPEIANCILWGNVAGEDGLQIALWHSSRLSVSYCDIQGGEEAISVLESTVNWEDGNIDVDPCFVETGYWDSNGLWVDGDYHLLPGSLCVDAGANNSLPSDEHDIDGNGDTTEMIPWDLDGDVRINDGDDDGNVVVDIGACEFFWPPVEVRMKLTPQALNPESNGNWIKAHFVLPDGFSIGDIDMNSPCKITEPYEPDIESAYVNAFINSEGLVQLEAAFERTALCRTVMSTEPIEVRTEGKFVSGQDFYGTDAVKITDNTLKYLGVMASYWLETDCASPDWCGGFDLDHSGVVNFADFALIDGCCAETVGD